MADPVREDWVPMRLTHPVVGGTGAGGREGGGESDWTRKANRRAMKVVVLAEADRVSGPGKNLIEFAEGARPTAHVSVVTYVRGEVPESEFRVAARRAGLDVYVVRERRALDPSVVPRMRQVVSRLDPDIVESHNVKSHLVIRLSGLARRYCWVAFHHGYTRTDLRVMTYNQLDRWSLRGARRVVTVCGSFAEDLVRQGLPRELIRIQHNAVRSGRGLDAVRRLGTRRRLAIGDDAWVILSVGRLSREKGHIDLIRALAQLRDKLPAADIHAVVVGEGPERQRIGREATRLGIQERLHLTGYQRDVEAFYEMADALALPSHTEGSPNVLLEAMAAGVPVVATDVGGVTEIVRDGEHALIVAKGDVEGMAWQLWRLWRDGELRAKLREKARRLVAEEYTREAYCRSVLRIYREALPQ